MVLLEKDGFCAWLCEHEEEIVGRTGMSWFSSPLSRYLQEVTGQLYGVDGESYGPAAGEVSWVLPRWARRFYALVERGSARWLTGGEAFDVLAGLGGR